MKNKNLPKVTVITPSYNQGNFVEETIQSVLQQTYPNIEYIVIDGNSDDGTKEVLNKYKDEIDVLIIEPDKGQSEAINKGVRLATGEFITWINSDDLLNPNAIEVAMSYFAANKSIDFIYGNVHLIDEGGKVIGELKGKEVDIPKIFYELDIHIPQQGSIWRAMKNNKTHELDELWHYVMDREFFLRMSLIYKYLYIPKNFGFFRQHSKSKSGKYYKMWAEEMPKMYNNLINMKNWNYKDKFNRKVLASSLIHSAYICIASGNYKESFEYLKKSINIYPFILLNHHVYKKPFNKLINIIK